MINIVCNSFSTYSRYNYFYTLYYLICADISSFSVYFVFVLYL